MKKHIIYLIVLAFFVLFSCSKDDVFIPQSENNALLKCKTKYYSLLPNTIPFIYEYQYDDYDNLIKELNFEREDKHLSRYFTYEYNDKNQLVLKEFYSENFDNDESSYEVIVKYTYQYENNKLNELIKYRKTPNQENDFYIHEVHSYKYLNDNLIEEVIDYEQTGSQSKYLFEYENNNLIKKTEYLFYSDDISKYVWKYDNYNRKIKELIYCNNVETRKTIFEFSNNKMNAKVYNGEGFIKEIYYEYDNCGNLIQEKKEIKNPISTDEMQELIIYEYF